MTPEPAPRARRVTYADVLAETRAIRERLEKMIATVDSLIATVDSLTARPGQPTPRPPLRLVRDEEE